MTLKDGVRLRNLQPQTVIAIMAAQDVFAGELKQDFVITSGSEGKHWRGSLHYSGSRRLNEGLTQETPLPPRLVGQCR